MKIIKIILLNLLILSIALGASLEEDSTGLLTKSFKKKQTTIEELTLKYKDDKRLEDLLQKMLVGELYYVKADKSLVYLKDKKDDEYLTTNLFTNKDLNVASKYDFKKIKINNKLRSVIKSSLAKINLFSSNVDTRYKSAKNLLNNLDVKNKVLINEALLNEKDSGVKEVLEEASTVLIAKYATGNDKLEAVKKLGEFLSPKALEILNEIKATSEDKDIQEATIKSIASIETSKSFYSILEKAFFGLSMGSVLLLAAIGLAVTFGVMKVINMAHGELIMIGAYTTYTIQQIMPGLIEYSIIIAVPAAFIVSGLVGILIERLVIRHLYGRPLETLLATFGISLVLQQVVRSIYSPLNQEVKTPEWMSGALEINSVLSLTYNRLYIIIFAIIVFLLVLFILNKTSLGLKVRAVSQNREIARAMGIKASWIDAITFGIGSGIAGVAGVALSQLTNVGPNLGQAYIVDSFMVVVFGGVGNLWGTLIAAFTLGEINKFIEPISGAVLAKVIILVFIILFIQKRPRGLFPKKGRDAED
ncbi:urea ABC transporter permease subunit UrtB [Poseidonibacter lekithochrous]|uniref:urea ABC transporter permease subunit UrtB n=1 Tax=Poseidonibacter TaxID=2321187 RepID=UPI001C0A4AD5|nr:MULTISPECIES: urea ABC transporter permease subunit UrtB [Poseidonibacter]MBU3013919.1 urea ABC transporter permease subunit UrtB [Poseidonibacter lekithochrous]MDO6827214.1 urea ABC transporter permease subunit UrtB [Poseidonibacter sp. 1_MG-2023]